MKVLVNDKIVESFQFPLTEAISFSILVWTLWGFAEALYWEKLYSFFDKDAAQLSTYIYISSFLLYLIIAAVVAVLVYGIIKWVLFTMGRGDDQFFRSCTLAGILGVFFVAVMYHIAQGYLLSPELTTTWKYGIIAFIVVFPIFVTYIMYQTASRVGFRIRRTGTLMFSILVVSIVLSFVRFPMFSQEQETRTLDIRKSIQKLMAYQYLSPREREK